MKLMHKFFVSVAIILSILIGASFSLSDTVPDQPADYVTDLAGIVDPATESRLNTFLAELERKTTAQLFVLTIKSLDGQSMEEFSIDVAHNKWKVGQKGKDNGVLFLIAMNDRKYRIEVGYGLEGILPDSKVGSIGRNVLVPPFRNGEYAKGVYGATLAIANVIATDAGVTISGMPAYGAPGRPVREKKPPGFVTKIFSFIIIIILIIVFIKNPRLFLLLLLFSTMGGRGGSWSGGRGGFGGGGGGGFGGGGASGGW